MKLDRKRPYGHTYGHAYAVFEQDGNLFDGAGDHLENDPIPQTETTNPDSTSENEAREFLITLLKEGPMRKEAVYKECQLRDISWESVTKEASLMDIYSFDQGAGKARKEMWKLGQD